MVELEAKLVKKASEKKEDIKSMHDVYSPLFPYVIPFQSYILQLVRICIAIAISTASCERSYIHT